MRIFPLYDVFPMTELDEKLLNHFLNPRNIGDIDKPDGYGRAVNPVNEYFTDIYLRVKNGIIDDVKFKTFGCVVTIAAASALTEIVKGKSVDEIIDTKDTVHNLLRSIHNELGAVPEKNWHCPPVAVQALLNALVDYYQKMNDQQHVLRLEKLLEEVHCFFKDGQKAK